MPKKALRFEEIQSLIKGAVEVREENGLLHCERFTPGQRRSYVDKSDFLMKAHATSGIMLECETDADALELCCRIEFGSSRTCADFDIKINGVLMQHECCDDFTAAPERGIFIPLDGSSCRVSIFFPPLAMAAISAFSQFGGSFIRPVVRQKKLLSFGDSITQGYDARYPSVAYAVQAAEAFDAEIFNKAVGGDFFNPDLLAEAEPFVPDMITVAYGTNDWSKHQREEFENDVTTFLQRLNELYPTIPVWLLLPLWRKDCDRITGVGTFASAREFIAAQAERYENICVVDGFEILPHITDIFSDGYLHPNDFGFHFMAQKLIAAMR